MGHGNFVKCLVLECPRELLKYQQGLRCVNYCYLYDLRCKFVYHCWIDHVVMVYVTRI